MICLTLIGPISRFNPRSHTGSDNHLAESIRPYQGFNPRSHTGSDSRKPENNWKRKICFNPRSHTGSDRCFQLAIWIPESFNPRSHTGSDLIVPVDSLHQIFVSIHAPTQGATIYDCTINPCYVVSIHAPTQGATLTASVREMAVSMFQSTLPHRERRKTTFQPA